jgi:beta-glucosidase
LRILYSLYAGGIMDTPQTGDLNVDARSSTRAALSRVVAEQGTVLLKNDGLLPLPTGVKKIAVIGSDGHDVPIFHGDGSGGVWSEYVVTPLQGIRNRVRGAAVSYANSNDTDLAISFAKSAEVAIVFLGKKSGEGDDYKLPFEQKEDDLVRAIAKVQKNIIVVAHVPAAVLMPWANDVRSIVCAFYPGQEMGNAVASILFGDVNPSGKLPVTFPTSEKAIPVNTPIQYPGINLQTNYTEKLQVGYRWYDANNVAPQFPFGHGLSYTRFNYTSVRMIGRLVRAGIQNIGQREGAEVVQMYIAFPKEADEPPQQLKNFMKITLKPGEAQNFAFDITDRDISIYDVASKSWKVVPGTYQVRIGSSSRDIRLTTTFTV